MWSRRSTKAVRRPALRGVSLSLRAQGAALAAVLLIGCSSAPQRVKEQQRETQAPASPAQASGRAAAGAQGAAAQSTAPQGAAPPPPPAPPAEAVAEFDRAVSVMRAGNTTEAQRRFEVLAVEYPQFAGADINLGILYRKLGQLDRSESALREAVQRNGSSAVAWNELGVTLRLRGEFRDAGDAYRKAIAADANFAAAYRNLGVLLDLYLGDAPGALAALERYKELSGEQKPVSGWIAELRHRVDKSAAPSAGASPPRAAHPTPARDPTPAGLPVEEPATARTGAGG
jgi:tetratricopeptide (TPR) repeat protein